MESHSNRLSSSSPRQERGKPHERQPRRGRTLRTTAHVAKPCANRAPLTGRRAFWKAGFLISAFALAALFVFGLSSFAQDGAGTPPTAPAVPAATNTSGVGAAVGWNIALVLVLTLINALFSMAETALVSIRRSRVEQLVEEGRRSARAVKRLVENPPRFIATTQVGITLLGFASAAAAATTLAAPLIGPLTSLGLEPRTAEAGAVIVVTIVIAFVSMVLGEIAPKSLAIQAPDRWALLLAPFINFCAVLFAPLSWLVVKVSGVLVRPFGAKAEFEQPMINKEELEQIINEGEKHGELDTQERVILNNVFDLTETIVRKVMTPRRDMTAVPVEADLQSVLGTILDSGHSRLPVYEGTTDHIVGIVHAKDLLPLLRSEHGGRSLDLRHTMRAATFVPESKSVLELLNEFRRSNQQVAIIKDEYDGTEGLVTIEDLLEEIVGPIHDEYDRDEPQIVSLSPDEWRLEGRLTIGDVNDALGTELPEGETYDTISGWVFSTLGREPLPGDHIRNDDYEFIVEQIEGRRIHTLRALRLASTDASDGDDDGSAAAAVTISNGPAAPALPASGKNGSGDIEGANANGARSFPAEAAPNAATARARDASSTGAR